MRHCLVLGLLIGLLSCGVDLKVDSHATISCKRDSQCPLKWRCGKRGVCVRPGIVEDLTPPELVTIAASDEVTVVVTFSEPMEPNSVSNVANYSITPSLAVLAVNAESQSAQLITAAQSYGALYTLQIQNVADVAGNSVSDDGLTGTFSGGGVPPDRSPPDMLAPTNEERFFGDELLLIWTPRSQASTYSVELSENSDFAPLFHPPIEVLTTSLDLYDVGTLNLEPRTYFWRVSADVTDPAETLPTRSFHVMDTVLYVDCPAGQTCATSRLVGNLSHPHESVAAAMLDATANGIREVRVAARGSDEAYFGLVTLYPGVSLFGGYDATFAARDPNANQTILEYNGDFVVGGIGINTVAAPEPAMELNGFVVRVPAGSTLVTSTALYLSNCDDSVVIRGNIFRSGDAAGFSRAAEVTGATGNPGPILTENEFYAGGTAWGESVGIKFSFGKVQIIGNPIIHAADSGASSFGIQADGGDVVIVDNPSISTGNALSANAFGLWLSGISGEVRSNTIQVGDALSTGPGRQSTGIYRAVTDPNIGAISIVDNHVTTGNGPTSKGISVHSWPAVQIVDNEVYVGDAAQEDMAASIGIEIKDFGDTLVSGNVVFAGNAATTNSASYYYCLSAGIYFPESNAAEQPCHTTITGNIIVAGMADVVLDPFARYVYFSGSYGVQVDEPRCSASLFNNVIGAQTAIGLNEVASVGLHLALQDNSENADTFARVLNNTIIAGSAESTNDRGYSIGIELDLGDEPVNQADVINNLVMTDGVANERIGIQEASDCDASCPFPNDLRNNLIFHVNPGTCPQETLYKDGDGTLYNDDVVIDGLLDELSSVAGTVGGNITSPAAITDLTTIFVDPNHQVTSVDPWDDLALLPGNLAINAGVNLYDEDEVSTDCVGTSRPACSSPPCDQTTPTWDIGAYEY